MIVTKEYLDGISEGRAVFRKEGAVNVLAHLANLTETARSFSASSPVGQLLRGERDFWHQQAKKLR